MEESNSTSESPQVPVPSGDNEKLESKVSAKSVASKVEAKKGGKVPSKPVKKPLSPSKPSTSTTTNIKKNQSKTEADTKIISKTMLNGQTKHEEKPKSSHAFHKDVTANKAPTVSTAKKTTSASTLISTSAVSSKVSKAPIEVKQNTTASKKAATDGVHSATKPTSEASNHSQENKLKSNKLTSSVQPKPAKSKPIVETSKDAKPVVSKTIKSTVTSVAKPPPKSTDAKPTSAKPKPAPVKVADKTGTAKAQTVSKPSQPVKGVKKVPPKEKASKVLGDDSKKLETKPEIINVLPDSSSEVSEKNVESDEIELKSNNLNEENNFDSAKDEHVEENAQHSLAKNEIPAVIPLDETPAIVTNSLTNISTEEIANELKELVVNPSEEHLGEENEEIENRKQKFLDVANTSCYDEASSKPLFSTSLDEPMDSENKDLEVLQSHIISESTEIKGNENWTNRIKDDIDSIGCINDDATGSGHAVLKPSFLDSENFDNKTLEINKHEILAYLIVDENETKRCEDILSDKIFEETGEEIPIYLNVGENEIKLDVYDDKKLSNFDDCIGNDFSKNCGDNVDDCGEHDGNSNDSNIDNLDYNTHMKTEDVQDIYKDTVNVHESCEDTIDLNTYNNHECSSDSYANSVNVHESCEDTVNDVGSAYAHNSFEDSAQESCEDYVHNSCEDSVQDSCLDDIAHNSNKDVIDNDLCEDVCTYVNDDSSNELSEDINKDKSLNRTSTNDDSYENENLDENAEYIEASVLTNKDNDVENENKDDDVDNDSQFDSSDNQDNDVDTDSQFDDSGNNENDAEHENKGNVVENDSQFDDSVNPTLENNFKNTFDNACIRDTILDHSHLGSDELEYSEQNLGSCHDDHNEEEQTDFINKFHCSDTQYLDDNCNVLEKSLTTRVLFKTELYTKECTEIMYTKESLESSNDLSVTDSRLSDNQSDCVYNENLQSNIISTDMSLADENSKYASVFHFNVNENQYDLSSHEKGLSNEIHGQSFPETNNEVFRDNEKSFEKDENQYRVLSKDLSDDSE